jgi:putative DNA primase/helicase
MLGYCTTGTNRDHKFFVAHGDGSNGKNVIMEAMMRVLGPYAKPIPAAMLMTSKYSADPEAPNALMASLKGVRLALASEVRDGQQLNSAVIKNHTGDGMVTARGMRENPSQFTQSHKIVMLTNPEPKIDNIDDATQSRLHFLPFRRKWNRPDIAKPNPELPNGDKTLAATLTGTDAKPSGEAEGILAWSVRGAVKYYKHGLGLPDEVKVATLGYIGSQDTFGQWLASMERCPPRQGMLARDLFAWFHAWCVSEDRELHPDNATAFGTVLKGSSVPNFKSERGRVYGLRPLALMAVPPK